MNRTESFALTAVLALGWALLLGFVGLIRYGKLIFAIVGGGTAYGVFVWWLFSKT